MVSSTPEVFLSPRSHKPLTDFVLAVDGHTYNIADLSKAEAKKPPVLNRLLQTAASEWACNPDPDHWQAKAIESPLSLRPMVRPVQLSDEVTYDLYEARELVEHWGVSPLTGGAFRPQETLRPNLAVQRMSADYVRFHPEGLDEEDVRSLLHSPLPTYDAEVKALGAAARARLHERHPNVVHAPLPIWAGLGNAPLVLAALILPLTTAGMTAGALIGSAGRQQSEQVAVDILIGAGCGAGLGALVAGGLIVRRGVMGIARAAAATV